MKSSNNRKIIAVHELINAYNELQNGRATHEELDAISLVIDTLIVTYNLDDSLYAG